jgi:hypothetical protein
MDEKTQADKMALREFLEDISCLDELLPWTEKNFNPFEVLGISKLEVQHSNLLGWMLDPKENHGFGDAFFKGILPCILEHDSAGKYDAFQLPSMDTHSFTVKREWNSIDILLQSSKERTVIAIENKIDFSEHDDQLNRYRKTLEKEYPDYHHVFVFLTPDGTEPSDPENWTVLTYKDVLNVLLNGIPDGIQLQPDVERMMEQYIDILRRDIVVDEELIKTCYEIYSNHKDAVGRINHHRSCCAKEKSSETVEDKELIDTYRKHKKAVELINKYRYYRVDKIIYETLAGMGKEGLIVYQDKWKKCFRTETLDRLLPETDETNIKCYGSNYVISVKEKDNKIYGSLRLYKDKIKDTSKQNMKKIESKRKPNAKQKEIFVTRDYSLPKPDAENWDEEVRKMVGEIVIDLIKEEENLLKPLLKQ